MPRSAAIRALLGTFTSFFALFFRVMRYILFIALFFYKLNNESIRVGSMTSLKGVCSVEAIPQCRRGSLECDNFSMQCSLSPDPNSEEMASFAFSPSSILLTPYYWSSIPLFSIMSE